MCNEEYEFFLVSDMSEYRNDVFCIEEIVY